MKTTKARRSTVKELVKNEEAVSPAIGAILMIVITVAIAAFVASFAYSITGGVAKAPGSAALVIEDARVGNYNVTVVHYGGDTIGDAFTTGASDWNNLRVKYNSVDIVWSGNVTAGGDGDENFASGEELKITVPQLASGDVIAVVYTPTGGVMQRVKVA